MPLTLWNAALFVLPVALLFRQQIIDRCRLIWFLIWIPGPIGLPLIGNSWMMKWKLSAMIRQLVGYIVYYMKQKTDLVCFWVGPKPMVVPFSAQSMKAVLESSALTTKGEMYEILQRIIGGSVLVSSGDHWRQRRKLLTPAFHFNILQGFTEIYDRAAKVFLEQLEPWAESGKTVNMLPYLKCYALDVICESAMGVKLDTQRNHEHPYFLAVERILSMTFDYSRFPWLWPSPIWHLLGYEREWQKNAKLTTDFTLKIVRERRERFLAENANKAVDEEARKKYIFLDLLLNFEQEGQLTEQDIREEVDTFVFAGHDSTTMAMSWGLWCLAHHPHYQERVIEEVDSIFGDSDRPCIGDDLKAMDYLEMCIKECQRLFTPIPMVFRQVEQDFQCVGKTIPKGSTLLISGSLVHLNPEYYANPFKFDPEHFSKEAVAKRHPFAYIPFSAGPRNCMGQKFAMQEQKTLLSWFFRRYRVLPGDIGFLRNSPLPQITLRPKHGVPVRIEKRR